MGNNLVSIKESDNIKVYHVIIEGKPQYEVGEIVSFPFSEARDFGKSEQYKQEAEKFLEDERQKNWMDYPSRYDCLFVARSIEDIKCWAKHKYYKGAIFYLYEFLLLNGKIVYLDTDWFEGLGEILSKGKLIVTHSHTSGECIKPYWTGIPLRTEETALKEGLFYGDIKVIDKVKMIYDSKTRIFSEIS